MKVIKLLVQVRYDERILWFVDLKSLIEKIGLHVRALIAVWIKVPDGVPQPDLLIIPEEKVWLESLADELPPLTVAPQVEAALQTPSRN